MGSIISSPLRRTTSKERAVTLALGPSSQLIEKRHSDELDSLSDKNDEDHDLMEHEDADSDYNTLTRSPSTGDVVIDNLQHYTDTDDISNPVNDIRNADIIVKEFRAFIHRCLIEKAVQLAPVQEILELIPASLSDRVKASPGHRDSQGYIQKAIDWHQYSSMLGLDEGLDQGIISRDFNIHHDEE